MSIKRRLARLEGGGTRCPECQYSPGEVPDGYEYIVHWVGSEELNGGRPEVEIFSSWGGAPLVLDNVPEPTPPCSTCGREFEVVIAWPAPLPPDLLQPPDYPPEWWPEEG